MRTHKVLGTLAAVAGLAFAGIGLAAPAQAAPAPTNAAAPVRPASVAGYFEVVNDHAGKCADVSHVSTAPGATVWEWECQGGDNQFWAPNDLGNGFMSLHVRHTGYCLSVRGGAGVEGAAIEQQPCQANYAGQWWRFAPVNASGHLWLESGFGGECLALSPNTSANGTSIVLGACSATTAKYWHFN